VTDSIAPPKGGAGGGVPTAASMAARMLVPLAATAAASVALDNLLIAWQPDGFLHAVISVVVGAAIAGAAVVILVIRPLNRSRADLQERYQAAVADALRDPLTGLGNHRAFQEELDAQVEYATRYRVPVALVLIDLDEFKQINDNLGHAVGDQALILAAKRLASAVRDADTVSRHGGDEFLVLLTEVSQRSDAVLIAGKLLAALASPIHLGDQELRLNASIGISIYPDDGEEVKTLIHLADAAMYRVKRRGLGGVSCHGDDPAVDGRA